jgi:Protein of unknown function (DUF1592)/Protein of unknown function (DUF1588)/Protein of unknown function (DUF1587)/Protein of unknown function (DUF1595)/Protein of unknown function (DUF1585)
MKMRSGFCLAAVCALFLAPPPGARAAVHRLTHSQYNNTVRDLLGDQTRPADEFPQEDFVDGFKNQSLAQDVPPLLAEAYANSAEKLARNAFLGGRDLKGLVPCTPRSPADLDCAERFVRRFGLRAFRRPLAQGETRRYVELLAREGERTGEFLQGARSVVEALLQSPKFLFRLESGTPELRDYETASRISYFLWDSMPDDELFRSAAARELSMQSGVDRVVRRMIADGGARQALDEFVSEWLRFDLLLNAVKDRTLYPQFTPELAVAMTEETRRLVSHIVWGDRNFIYGFPPPASEFARVSFPAASNRTGLIGEGTFLASTSKPGETSPTIRGLAVRQQFLCQQVPDPPPGTNANLPPQMVARPQTTRERLLAHRSSPICAGCHSLMDPVGFGLEKFDAIGRTREKQRIVFMPDHEHRKDKPITVDLELDNRGTVSGMPHSDFSSPKELGKLLASDQGCQECIVRQLFRYAAGRRETQADNEAIHQGFAVFRDSGFRFKELMKYWARFLAQPGED